MTEKFFEARLGCLRVITFPMRALSFCALVVYGFIIFWKNNKISFNRKLSTTKHRKSPAEESLDLLRKNRKVEPRLTTNKIGHCESGTIPPPKDTDITIMVNTRVIG
jgi:glucan phosphoethanolaminetransferase (alkaline phosphatase superfamily)